MVKRLLVIIGWISFVVLGLLQVPQLMPGDLAVQAGYHVASPTDATPTAIQPFATLNPPANVELPEPTRAASAEQPSELADVVSSPEANEETPQPALPVTSFDIGAPVLPGQPQVLDEWVHRGHLSEFVERVANGASDEVVGVYVPDLFSLPVLQQPDGLADFVSKQDETVTQFSMPADFGVVGLLAHNYLSGRQFFELESGQDFALVYGDRQVQYFRITRIERFQALSPTSPYSEFINLSDPDQTEMTSGELFRQVYTTQGQVVFQTCIEANGNASWGRIFVIAEPIEPLTSGF